MGGNIKTFLGQAIDEDEKSQGKVVEMENQKTRDETLEKFTWTIQNFSKLSCEKLYSESFFVCGHSWRILIYPKGDDVDFLSIFLVAGDVSKFPCGWSRLTKFKLALINQVNGKMTITEGTKTEQLFNAKQNSWGFQSFIPLAELHDCCRGFIENDTCVIEAEIFASKSEHENQLDQAVRKIDVSADSAQVDQAKGMYSASFGELMDFRGLGKIEKAFVPLLDEVCSRHPSLIECQHNKSRRFTEWAFTALGRVLFFLKTKKVIDMKDDAREHLQILWNELETFGFDLEWLKPHVESALARRLRFHRVMNVIEREQNVEALKMEKNRLKEKMDAIDVDIEIAIKDIEKTRDAVLGYGVV
ncbi:MATH domain and coiled-coil domain-containing protein At3g58370-like [Gastrolobium bilobum]|uniref:MATH domain and coiled-coil domain-containing protein At3g58370-like n=1 Tax=Gastrolobium bilobum TaxID=150636 RepID=UPI002AAF8CE1|nr:MATH domain and coiled-coil domain-containing protein At3g58370-like [Gastrolobium bilobum]